MKIAPLTEYRILEPDTLLASVDLACKEAMERGYRTVCVPPLFVKHARAVLGESKVSVSTVVGYPFGFSAIEAKLAEVVLAIVDGAGEISLVINTAALKNADWQYLAKELNSILPVVKSRGRILKVVLEAGLLTDKELIACCDIYGAAGVDVMKASTGHAGTVVPVETIKLLRNHLANQVKLEAVCTGQDVESAIQLLEAGADYISLAYPLVALSTIAEQL